VRTSTQGPKAEWAQGQATTTTQAGKGGEKVQSVFTGTQRRRIKRGRKKGGSTTWSKRPERYSAFFVDLGGELVEWKHADAKLGFSLRKIPLALIAGGPDVPGRSAPRCEAEPGERR